MAKDKCDLTDLELIDACNKWVSKLAETGGGAWSLQVPVNFNGDPDMLFVELANRFKERIETPSLPAQPEAGDTTRLLNEIDAALQKRIDNKIAEDMLSPLRGTGKFKNFIIYQDAIEAFKKYTQQFQKPSAVVPSQGNVSGVEVKELANMEMTSDALYYILTKVSLIDLSGFQFDYGNDDNEHWINVENNGVVVESIGYDGNLFKVLNRERDDMVYLNPMIDVFKAWFKYLTGYSSSKAKEDLPDESYNAWPTKDVLAKLIWATEYLLNEKSYDGHGWEEISHCVKRGKELLEGKITTPPNNWIDIKFKQPEYMEVVLAVNEVGSVVCVQYTGDSNNFTFDADVYATIKCNFWQPLPSPPQDNR